jgi:hypothetical protein
METKKLDMYWGGKANCAFKNKTKRTLKKQFTALVKREKEVVHFFVCLF